MENYIQTITIGLGAGLGTGMFIFILNLGARKVLGILELIK
jgi:hypothetical protein